MVWPCALTSNAMAVPLTVPVKSALPTVPT
jgi:hypothetical protein